MGLRRGNVHIGGHKDTHQRDTVYPTKKHYAEEKHDSYHIEIKSN